MEKLSPNRAQLFVRKYTDFTMGGTVALRSVNKSFPESYSSAATCNSLLTMRRSTTLSKAVQGDTNTPYVAQV